MRKSWQINRKGNGLNLFYSPVVSVWPPDSVKSGPFMSLLLILVIKTGKRTERNHFMEQRAMIIEVKKMIQENKNGKLLHKKVRKHAMNYNGM